MLEFIRDGGIFAMLVGAIGVVGGIVCLVHLILAILRPGPDIEGVVLAVIGVTLGLGVLGAGVGFAQTAQAVSAAAPAQRAALGEASVSISLYPLILAMVMAAAQVTVTCVARTVRANRWGKAVVS